MIEIGSQRSAVSNQESEGDVMSEGACGSLSLRATCHSDETDL
jgi:hypothetical protein